MSFSDVQSLIGDDGVQNDGPTFVGRAAALRCPRERGYFFLAMPVVVRWPGAYSDAPGAVDFLAFCIL